MKHRGIDIKKQKQTNEQTPYTIPVFKRCARSVREAKEIIDWELSHMQSEARYENDTS